MTDPDTLSAVTDAAADVFTDPSRRAAAAAYLDRRGIDTSALPNDWIIGYAPPGWTRLVDTLARDFPAQALVDAGVACTSSRGSLIDTFRNRVVVGIHHTDGSTAGFIGRDLSGAANAPKYLNTKRHECFDKSSLIFGLWEGREAEGQLVLAEGPLDVLAIAARRPATGLVPVATCGTALTDNQADQLARTARRDSIVVAMDADAAGRAASITAGEKLRRAGVNDVRVATLPRGTDPAEFLANPANGVEPFRAEHALPLFTVEAEHAIAAQGDRMQWIEGRLAAARSISTRLSTYPPAFAARQIGWLANALHLDASTVTDEFAKVYRVGPEPMAQARSAATRYASIEV